jgi:hypothetical protein
LPRHGRRHPWNPPRLPLPLPLPVAVALLGTVALGRPWRQGRERGREQGCRGLPHLPMPLAIAAGHPFRARSSSSATASYVARGVTVLAGFSPPLLVAAEPAAMRPEQVLSAVLLPHIRTHPHRLCCASATVSQTTNSLTLRPTSSLERATHATVRYPTYAIATVTVTRPGMGGSRCARASGPHSDHPHPHPPLAPSRCWCAWFSARAGHPGAGFDQVGHGKSPGKPALVTSYQDLLDDTLQFADQLRTS